MRRRRSEMTRACAVAMACVLVASQRTAKAVRHESPPVAHGFSRGLEPWSPPVAHGFSRGLEPWSPPVARGFSRGLEPWSPPVAHGFSRASGPLDEATVLLKQAVAERKIAGAVAAVSHHGKTVYLESAGVQDLATGAPMTGRTLFRIYSMTKPVTAAAVMMLLEEGKFTLADPVSKYLPEFGDVRVAVTGGAARPPVRAISIADLLLHTSGLSHRTAEIYQTPKVRVRTDTL